MKRILFVDDDPKILDGLRRMLRGQRGEWDMIFADGGEAALARLAEAPFDVIVSDMRMPGIDGAALLSKVQELYPQTVRIVLSGHAELESALRAVPVAHQFLTKPCDSKRLREVVERACSLQALLDDEALRRTVTGMGSLPSLPKVYHALAQTLANPEVVLEEVVEVVEKDQAICAKVLQLVNSGFFALERSIGDIKEAVTYLGFEMLKNLVLSVEVFRQLDSGEQGLRPFLEAQQDHSALAARIARQILPDKRASEDAFMAAMLHDVGRLVIATKLPEVHAQITERVANEPERPLHELEEELFGISHAEIGAFLLGIWGLPYVIVEAVANHHHPSRVEPAKLDVLCAVHLADCLAHQGAVVGEGPAAPTLDEELLSRLGVSDRLPAWRGLATDLAGVA